MTDYDSSNYKLYLPRKYQIGSRNIKILAMDTTFCYNIPIKKSNNALLITIIFYIINYN